MLTKANPDLRGSINEMLETKKVLQQCIDTKKTRKAPTDLNAELFKFSQFPKKENERYQSTEPLKRKKESFTR